MTRGALRHSVAIAALVVAMPAFGATATAEPVAVAAAVTPALVAPPVVPTLTPAPVVPPRVVPTLPAIAGPANALTPAAAPAGNGDAVPVAAAVTPLIVPPRVVPTLTSTVMPAAALTPAAPPAAAGAAAPGQRINTTNRAIVLTVPMRASGPLGQVQITIAPDDSLSVSVGDFTNALAQVVKPGELDKIKAAAGPDGQLSAKQAATLGYKLSYDSENVELVVDFDTAILATRSVDIVRAGRFDAVQPDRSAGFAAYLNYRIGESTQLSGDRKGDVDFLGDFELAGRIANTISFDNFATVDPRNEGSSFSRNSSRIFYDLPGPAIRFTAGDLFTETAGFQTDPQITGLNVSHLIDTFYPGAPVSGTSSRNLVLNRDADVQIIVNGIPVSQLHLSPGSYDLRNLPVAQGANNLQAVITDSTGERRVQNFSFFQSAQLLNPGISEYTLSAGVLAPLGDHGPDYTNDPAVSGFYRRGITDQLTLGANVQAAKYDQVFGLDAVFGSPLGLFSGSVAFNHLNTGQTGGAARVQYSWADHTNSRYIARTLNVFVEYDSRYFNPLSSFSRENVIDLPGVGGVTIPVPPIPFDLGNVSTRSQALIVTADLNQPLTRSLVLQLDGTYTHGRDGAGDRGTASALITYQAPFQTTIGLGVTYQWAPRNDITNFTSGRGISFLATLTHRFGPQTILNASADRFNQRASFVRSPSRPIDDYFANADFSHTRFGTSGNATAGYETNRGDIDVTYTTLLDRSGDIASQQVGTFFTGSLVFADGRFAPGRRITDAFAVIGKDASLGDRQVIISSRFANDVIARSGLFGPAVVPLSSYQRALVPYDVKDLPPGYDLGSGAFDLYPWYHSGFSLKVGSAYNVTALGDLLDTDGKPLALRAGSAVSLTDPKAPKVDVITNRTGRFAASGLAPGRYRITMSGDSSLVYDITVVQNPQMLTRFGSLKPNAR